MRHVKLLSDANRDKPFIFHDKSDIIELVWRQIIKNHHYFGDNLMYVALSIGVDVTVIFQGWRIIIPHNKFVGGYTPNRCLGIGEKSKEDLIKLLKLCVDGKKVVVPAEVKVAVASLH